MQRTALVTGASSGIGAAVANLLCERGFDVFGTTRSNNPVSQKFQMISLNVDSDNSVLECVGKVLAKKERVNVLVNSAGYALMGGAEETSIAEAKAQFETTTRARFDQRHASAGTSSRRRRLGFRSD